MKGLNLFGKLLFLLNSIVAFLLVISFVLPFFKPSSFPLISLLSLAVSPLILLTFLFGLYWLVQLKRQFLLSSIVLALAYVFLNPIYEFSTSENDKSYANELSIMSYNVRLFNKYEKKEDGSGNVQKFIKNIIESNADIVCIQEFSRSSKVELSGYPYKYIHYRGDKFNMGHAIFSKYPLLNKGAFDFKRTQNNTLFVDVVVKQDTLRVYNLHLKSMSIQPSVNSLQGADKAKLISRLTNAFTKQEQQIDVILAHSSKVKYPVIFSGDFNNTSFSYIYRKLRAGKKDAFIEQGNGLGTTFRFDSYPMRIDYILTSETLDIIDFETYEETLSDHHPIKATIGW